MFELIKFELYKIVSKKRNIIVLLSFVFLFLFLYSQSGLEGVRDKDIPKIKQAYSEWSGALTEEKVGVVRERQDKLNLKMEEAILESSIKDPQGTTNTINPWSDADTINATIVYPHIINRWDRYLERKALVSELKEDIRTAEAENKKDFEYLKNLAHYNMIKDIKPPVGDYFKGWQQLIDFTNTYGFVILGALALLMLSPVFAEDFRSSGMGSLILSSRHGRKKLVTAKIITSSLVISGCAIIFIALNLIVVKTSLGLEGGNVALREMYKYLESPFDLSVFQYFLIQQATFVFGVISFGLLVLLLSAYTRNSLTSFFIGGSIYGVPFFLTRFLDLDSGPIERFAIFSYGELIMVEKMFLNFNAFNLLGTPVLYLHIMYPLFLLLTAVSVFLVYSIISKKQIGQK